MQRTATLWITYIVVVIVVWLILWALKLPWPMALFTGAVVAALVLLAMIYWDWRQLTGSNGGTTILVVIAILIPIVLILLSLASLMRS